MVRFDVLLCYTLNNLQIYNKNLKTSIKKIFYLCGDLKYIIIPVNCICEKVFKI